MNKSIMCIKQLLVINKITKHAIRSNTEKVLKGNNLGNKCHSEPKTKTIMQSKY